MARGGYRIFDSDTHVGPDARILAGYFSEAEKDRLRGWEAYKSQDRSGHAPHPSAGGILTLLIHALPSAHYEPLRHPSAPGLSLAGVRLIIPDHASGFPVLRALSLCTCCRHYPGAADRRTCRSKIAHPYQPSPIPLSGRPAHRPFRGLLGVYSRCGLHTRAVTKFVTAIRGLQTFRHLHACPGCFRLERSPGGPCTHWKTPPCHGARGIRSFAGARANGEVAPNAECPVLGRKTR